MNYILATHSLAPKAQSAHLSGQDGLMVTKEVAEMGLHLPEEKITYLYPQVWQNKMTSPQATNPLLLTRTPTSWQGDSASVRPVHPLQ